MKEILQAESDKGETSLTGLNVTQTCCFSGRSIPGVLEPRNSHEFYQLFSQICLITSTFLMFVFFDSSGKSENCTELNLGILQMPFSHHRLFLKIQLNHLFLCKF